MPPLAATCFAPASTTAWAASMAAAAAVRSGSLMMASDVRSPRRQVPHAVALRLGHVAVVEPVFDGGWDRSPRRVPIERAEEAAQEDLPCDRCEPSLVAAQRWVGGGEEHPGVGDVVGGIAPRC